jgi:hypothetical protein
MISDRALPRFVRDLLASPPHRGGGLNLWMYRVARVLHPYRDANEIINLLRAATDGEPIKRGEIERAVERSKLMARQPGQPYSGPTISPWPTVDKKLRAEIVRGGGGVADLWEESPVRIEDNASHTEEIIDALFPGNPLLCCGFSNSKFDTRSREEWRGKLSTLQLIVPSPMTARSGLTQEGKRSPHALSITGPRRYLVVEFDLGSVDDDAALLLYLAETKGPLALVVHSGNKSLHGWFACHGQTEERLRRFMERVVSLGADPATWTRSQFVRIPDGTRKDGRRQVVFYFNPQVI